MIIESPKLIIELKGSNGGRFDLPLKLNSGSIKVPRILKYIFAAVPSYPMTCSIVDAPSIFLYIFCISITERSISTFLDLA